MAELSKDFKFKKQFGQNFIFDKNFINSIVSSLNLDKETCVLEIGAGAGVLTEVLANNFKKVISFEIDKTLKETLNTLKEKYNNLNFIFEDVLNVKTQQIDDMFEQDFVMIANLPYYITSQIIFKFLFESKKISKLFVMVQKEVGYRFCAEHSTKDYGIPTVLINCFGNCKIVKNVSRTVFTPVPNVDSCIIQIEIDRQKFQIKEKESFIKFVSNCFKMKRKTLYNNLLSAGFSKDKILNSISKLNLIETVRPENLTAKNYEDLFEILNNNK